MITIESDRTAAAVQTIASEVLGHQVSVSAAGRLGNEINLASATTEQVKALRTALRRGGHRVYVTRSR